MDYDAIADVYDRRYLRNDYGGIEQILRDFVVESRSVLEAGCGTGHWLEALARDPRPPDVIVGLDCSARMLARARTIIPPVHLVRGSAEILPFGPACFDRVVCINALQHFSDKPSFIASARQVLRKRGRLLTILLDPHTRRDRWWIYEFFPDALAADRARYPAAAAIRDWMRDAGFTACRTTVAQHMALRRPAQAALDQGDADRSATSQLAILSDEAYESGMRKLQLAANVAATHGQTLELTVDLTLFATTGWAT